MANLPTRSNPKSTSTSPAIRRWASVKQAAEYVGIDDPRTVRKWIAEGRITGYKLNERVLRVDLNEIDAAMTPVGGAV